MDRRKVFFEIESFFIYESFSIALEVLLLVVSMVFAGLWLTDIELNISVLMAMAMIESRRFRVRL